MSGRRITFSEDEWHGDKVGQAFNLTGSGIALKHISVERRLLPKDKLITAVHEVIHICDLSLCETTVEKWGRTIADVLWRMGYRKE